MYSNPHLQLVTQIPEALTLRDTSFSFVIGTTLFVAVVLLAMARAAQSNIYASMAIGLVKIRGVRGFVRDTMPFNGRASILLILNYWISFGLIVYLLGEYFGVVGVEHWTLAAVVPIALLFFHLGSMVLTGWVLGERDVFRPLFMMKLLGAQFLGIAFFFCALIWVLRPEFTDITLQIVFWIFCAESAFRILKGFSVVLGMGVSWYYLILYFCTLEILPLLIVYHYLPVNLMD